MSGAPENQRLADHPPIRTIDEDPFERFEKELQATGLGPETCVPEYYAGDRMDWDLAIAALFDSPVGRRPDCQIQDSGGSPGNNS